MHTCTLWGDELQLVANALDRWWWCLVVLSVDVDCGSSPRWCSSWEMTTPSVAVDGAFLNRILTNRLRLWLEWCMLCVSVCWLSCKIFTLSQLLVRDNWRCIHPAPLLLKPPLIRRSSLPTGGLSPPLPSNLGDKRPASASWLLLGAEYRTCLSPGRFSLASIGGAERSISDLGLSGSTCASPLDVTTMEVFFAWTSALCTRMMGSGAAGGATIAPLKGLGLLLVLLFWKIVCCYNE